MMMIPFNLAAAAAGYRTSIYLGRTREIWKAVPFDDLVGLELERPDPFWLDGLPREDAFEVIAERKP